MSPFSLPWKPSNHFNSVQNPGPHIHPASAAPSAPQRTFKVCAPLPESADLARLPLCEKPASKRWPRFRFPVRGLTCTSRPRPPSFIYPYSVTKLSTCQPPRALPRHCRQSQLPKRKRLMAPEIKPNRSRAPHPSRTDRPQRVKLAHASFLKQVNLQSSPNDQPDSIDLIDLYGVPVASPALEFTHPALKAKSSRRPAAAVDSAPQDDLGRAKIASVCPDQSYSHTLPILPSAPLIGPESSSSAQPDIISRSPSERKVLDRFCKDLELFAVQARAYGRLPICSPSLTSGTSLHTVAVLLPFHGQFRAAGLAVTSQDQYGHDRDQCKIRSKGKERARENLPRLPEEAPYVLRESFRLRESSQLDPVQTDGAWSDHEESSSDCPASGSFTEIDFTKDDLARLALIDELPQRRAKPAKSFSCMQCCQSPSTNSELAGHKAPVVPPSGPDLPDNLQDSQRIKGKGKEKEKEKSEKKPDETLPPPTRRPPPRPSNRIPRPPDKNTTAQSDSQEGRLLETEQTPVPEEVSHRSPKPVIQTRESPVKKTLEKKASGRRKRHMTIPEVLESAAAKSLPSSGSVQRSIELANELLFTSRPTPHPPPHLPSNKDVVQSVKPVVNRPQLHSLSDDYVPAVAVASPFVPRPVLHTLDDDRSPAAPPRATTRPVLHSLDDDDDHQDQAVPPATARLHSLAADPVVTAPLLTRPSIDDEYLVSGAPVNRRQSQGRVPPLVHEIEAEEWVMRPAKQQHAFAGTLPVLPPPESSNSSAPVLPFTWKLAVSDPSSLERAICAVADADTTELLLGESIPAMIKGTRKSPPRVPKRQSSRRAVAAATGRKNKLDDFAGEVRTWKAAEGDDGGDDWAADDESVYAELDDGDISDRDVLQGLGIAMSAACNRDMDAFIRDRTGLRLRRFLADLRAFESLQGDDKRQHAQAAAEQRARRRRLEQRKLKEERRMARRLREWNGK